LYKTICIIMVKGVCLMNNCKKKRLLLIVAVFTLVVLGVGIFDYCRINGREIKYIDKLDEGPVYVQKLKMFGASAQESKENNNAPVIQLSTDQVKQLQTLLKENTYKRRFTNVIYGGIGYDYLIFSDWDNDGHRTLYAHLVDAGYITFEKHVAFGRGNVFHEIKNPEFMTDFTAIIE